MAQVTCGILQQMNDKSDEKFERMMQQMAKQNKLLANLSQVRPEPTKSQAGQPSRGALQQQGFPREGKKVDWKEGLPHPVSGNTMRRCKYCRKNGHTQG